jgi:hypothetical protein
VWQFGGSTILVNLDLVDLDCVVIWWIYHFGESRFGSTILAN